MNGVLSFPYDVTEDRNRFQKTVIDGDSGYYDAVAKKFIPQDTLDVLLGSVIPEKEFKIHLSDEYVISQAINRIRKNLSLYQKNPAESYAQIFLKYLSERYLRSVKEQKLEAAVLYIDIVGSTKIATEYSTEDLSSIVRIFSQEMPIMISKHTGFVLKYTGDAVIAYFPQVTRYGNSVENAIRCSNSMNFVIKNALNPAFKDFALPEIQVRISVDYGINEIVFLGQEPDLIGHSITIAAKMTRFAKPSQIVIGDKAFRHLGKEYSYRFKIADSSTGWNYQEPTTGEIYPIYVSEDKT